MHLWPELDLWRLLDTTTFVVGASASAVSAYIVFKLSVGALKEEREHRHEERKMMAWSALSKKGGLTGEKVEAINYLRIHKESMSQLDLSYETNNITFYHFEMNFSDTTLPHVDFDQVALPKANFQRSKIKDAFFQSAVLSGSDFTDAVLDGVNFTEATLREVDFTRTVIWFCTFEGADLEKTSFKNAFIMGDLDLTNSKYSTEFYHLKWNECDCLMHPNPNNPDVPIAIFQVFNTGKILIKLSQEDEQSWVEQGRPLWTQHQP